ncbi:uncharacterized protein LOC124690283 [Lolium rigidum]|uniref:uncharacterized protein LOC124690283 n=1 Tax=Lolium rigidum TaxID=89674 RepID=UPI001F5DC1D0|nr:uncharacterized protein LOC124690283 [Lolium rigidum]
MAHPPADRRPRSPRADCDHHRFLRPGALARLRDSKIVARSLRSAARALPPSSPPPRSPAHLSPAEGAVPHFYFGGAAASPRYPLRKKLAAARGVVFLPPHPPPMSPGAAEAFLGAFALAPSDLLAAH